MAAVATTIQVLTGPRKPDMRIILYFLISLWLIFLGVILGDYGSWYFAWLVGTVMIVLISAAGGALMDTQLEEEQQQK
jgi:predicted outer membrane lipoprotein